MGDYDRPERHAIIKRGLIGLGLDYKHAKNHDVATCPNTNRKTTIPRHKKLNKYTVGSIVDFLLTNDYNEAEVKKAFKW